VGAIAFHNWRYNTYKSHIFDVALFGDPNTEVRQKLLGNQQSGAKV